MAIKRVCPRCGGLHPIGTTCYKQEAKKDTEARRFRNSRKWQKKATEIKQRDHYMCIYCLEQERRYNFKHLEVHHIVPLAEDLDLGLEETNLVTLCNEHHRQAENGEIPRKELQEIVNKYYEKR